MLDMTIFASAMTGEQPNAASRAHAPSATFVSRSLSFWPSENNLLQRQGASLSLATCRQSSSLPKLILTGCYMSFEFRRMPAFSEKNCIAAVLKESYISGEELEGVSTQQKAIGFSRF